MKKLLFMAFAIVVSCIIGSCTAETEETSTAQSKKVNEAKLKIMEMAKDYGLNVRIDEEFLDEYADQINLDTLDMCFKALADLKGIYKLEKPTSDGIISQTKQKKSTRRTAKEYRYTYESPELVTGKYGEYVCNCCLSWVEDSATSHIISASAHGNIELLTGPLLVSHSDIGTYIRNKTIIDVDGIVDVYVHFGDLVPDALWVDWKKTITVRFEVYGDYNGETNAIVWDCEEDIYHDLKYEYS